MQLITTVVDTAAWDSPTFDIYFPPEARSRVATVFQKLHGGSSCASTALTQVVIEKADVIDYRDPARRPRCKTHPTILYTRNDPPIIHVCPLVWEWRSRREVATRVCDSPIVTRKMEFLGFIMLHEFTHIDLFNHGTHIKDWAYGPLKVRNLRASKETDKYPVYNADSYAWFAL
ncbi:MAG: hypothetical protein L6R35_007112, partial [Caloplaca aegaea]